MLPMTHADVTMGGQIVATTRDLFWLAESAAAGALHRQLTEETVRRLDPEGWHVLTPVTLLNEADPSGRVRMLCIALLKLTGADEPLITCLDAYETHLMELVAGGPGTFDPHFGFEVPRRRPRTAR